MTFAIRPLQSIDLQYRRLEKIVKDNLEPPQISHIPHNPLSQWMVACRDLRQSTERVLTYPLVLHIDAQVSESHQIQIGTRSGSPTLFSSTSSMSWIGNAVHRGSQASPGYKCRRSMFLTRCMNEESYCLATGTLCTLRPHRSSEDLKVNNPGSGIWDSRPPLQSPSLTPCLMTRALSPAEVTINVQEFNPTGSIVAYNSSTISLNLAKYTHWIGETVIGCDTAKFAVALDRTSNSTLTVASTVQNFTNADTALANIQSNGFNITHDVSCVC